MAQWNHVLEALGCRFDAWNSGLRIWCCGSCGNCGSDLIPGLGSSYAAGWPKKPTNLSVVKTLVSNTSGENYVFP